MPLVSVVMPVRNQGQFLPDAVRSILDQTLRDLELLIVDDGSTDGTRDCIRTLATRDRRIRWFEAEDPGVAAALNRGMAEARGAFVARMDADDVAVPTRLARQVAFLDARPHVGLCGGWVRSFGSRRRRVRRYAADHATIESRMLFGNEIAHPTVMARRTALEGNGLAYDPAYRGCEDYELWARAVRCFQIENLGEVLVHYREHVTQETRSGAVAANDGRERVQERLVGALVPDVSRGELRIHGRIGGRWLFAAMAELLAAEGWLRRLKACNQSAGRFPQAVFGRTISEQWFLTSYAAAGLGLSAWSTYWRSELSRQARLPNMQIAKFATRCATRRPPVW